MKFETLCYLLAAIGAILTIIGRRLLYVEAASFSKGWRWAVRVLPLADVMFLGRYWEYAKAGAFTSLLGLGFLLPLVATTMRAEKPIGPAEYAARGRALDLDAKRAIYVELKAEFDARIEAKQRKLQQLNTHLGAWYSNMNSRRATALINSEKQELVALNDEAEAYKALHQVAKDEAGELQEMLNKQEKGFPAYTLEDFGKHLYDAENQRAREAQLSAKR